LRRLKDLIRQLLHMDDTPEHTALAYAIGVLLGFSPFLGLHTIGGVAIAFLFRLNRVAVLVGVWMNLPWWIIPYYTVATAAGMKVTGFHLDPGLLASISDQGWSMAFFERSFGTASRLSSACLFPSASGPCCFPSS